MSIRKGYSYYRSSTRSLSSEILQ